MSFNLSDGLVEAHMEIKRRDSLLTTYLLTLGDGTTFNVLGGKAREVRYKDSQAILQFEKAEDVKKFQSLPENAFVLLNGELMFVKDAYDFIGRNYVPRPINIGTDDSDKIYSELLAGRKKVVEGVVVNFLPEETR